MSSGQKTVSVFVSVIGALLTLILGLGLHWPVWTWLGAIAVLLAAGATAVTLTRRTALRERFPEHTLPERPAPPVERREVRVHRVSLPSNTEDYDFRFSANVRWCPTDPGAGSVVVDPGAIAVESVLQRASAVTATMEPGRASLVQHELSGFLASMEPVREGHVLAMALDVELTLSEADRTRLDRLAAIRKDVALWEQQRAYEQNKRAYLGDDVLQSTGSAVVWWLAKNDDHVEKTVKDLGLLAKLASAANGKDVDEHFRYLVPEAFTPLFAPDSAAPPEAGPQPPSQPQPPPPAPSPADVFGELLRRIGLAPGDDAVPLLAEQVSMAVALKDVVAAEEIRRRFAAPSFGARTNGAAPAGEPESF
ncbi:MULTISPECIES: hypothetical protein [unclassified Streptomyces]|uniref:hypothetical protein n=1 Tax=unclassified Streptomyces TaxID=2593676 RepID=UPI00278BB92A|nr:MULTISPECIES: hypothetical protein [unclassified Streptomyces]